MFFPRVLGTLLTALLVLTACHDDSTNVMDSSAMVNQTLVPTTYSFMWNGSLKEQRTDVSAVFHAIDGKTDQMMQMSISGIIPSVEEDQTLQVSVSPQTDEVQYAGQFSDPRYELAVAGSWFPYTNGNYFKLKCTYKILSGVVFNEPSELVLPQRTEEYPKIYMTFDENGTVIVDYAYMQDKDLKVTELMTVNYWFSKQNGKVILDLTEAQASTFSEKWHMVSGDIILDQIVRYKDFSRYALYINLTETETNNYLTL